MNILRLAEAKQVCKVPLGYCEDDPRLVSTINRADERLLYRLKSKGTIIKYRVCVNDGCLTWPRRIETIEAVALCDRPLTIRNQFFEFLGTGFGIIKTDSCGLKLVDQGENCAFDDVTGTGKKLTIYADVTETTTEKVIVQYYDSNGQWVRTQNSDGIWIDGEELAIPTAGNYTDASLECAPNGLVKVIKPLTNGTIRLYEKTIAGGALKPLAYYEPSETVPVYRRSLIPSLTNAACCGNTSNCDNKTVDILGKIRFIPAADDNDFLSISHVEAIRLGCQAVAKEERDLINEATPYWMMAIELLNEQLAHHQGTGTVQPIRVTGTLARGVPVMV